MQRFFSSEEHFVTHFAKTCGDSRWLGVRQSRLQLCDHLFDSPAVISHNVHRGGLLEQRGTIAKAKISPSSFRIRPDAGFFSFKIDVDQMGMAADGTVFHILLVVPFRSVQGDHNFFSTMITGIASIHFWRTLDAL